MKKNKSSLIRGLIMFVTLSLGIIIASGLIYKAIIVIAHYFNLKC